MPYIKKSEREALDGARLAQLCQLNPGDLTYCIYKLMLQFQANSYKDHAQVLGCIEAAKLEYYRRAVAPYENDKITLNGDVFRS
jgi:hypothetical protein